MTIYRSFQVLNARVEARDGSGSVPLNVKGLQVTMDQAWSPFVQATLTCAQPDAATVAAIEPRRDAVQRVRFTLRQVDGTTTTDSAFDLGLRSRRATWSRRELTLTAASDEALWQDWASGSSWDNSGSAPYEIIGTAAERMGWIRYATAPAVPNFVDYTPVSNVTTAQGEGIWDPGVNGWDFVTAFAEAAGFWLYCGEDAVFRMLKADAGSRLDQNVYTMTADDPATATVLDVDEVVDRDNPAFGNYAVVAYTGNSPTQYAVDSGTTANRKAISVTRARKKPSNATLNAATKIRTTAESRGKQLDVRCLAHVFMRPPQSWSVTYGGTTFTGIVQRVSFDFPSGLAQLLVTSS